jgi:hypothetical protein
MIQKMRKSKQYANQPTIYLFGCNVVATEKSVLVQYVSFLTKSVVFLFFHTLLNDVAATKYTLKFPNREPGLMGVRPENRWPVLFTHMAQ